MNLPQLTKQWRSALAVAEKQYEDEQYEADGATLLQHITTLKACLKDIQDVRMHSMKDILKTYKEGFKTAMDTLQETYNDIERREE